MLQLNSLKAQDWCDSTLSLCDSISIDSIFFTNSPTLGDRVHFQITSNHYFLYAPSSVICPINDSVEFVDNSICYTGLFGPVNIHPYYEFLNISVAGDTLVGHILVDNRNNFFQNCMMSFSIAIPGQNVGMNNDWLQNELEVFPNPTNNLLSINFKNNNVPINNIQLIDLLGRRQEINFTLPLIDLSNVPSGLYILHLELNDTRLVTEKIIIR